MQQITKQIIFEGLDSQTFFASIERLERAFKECNSTDRVRNSDEELLTREEVAQLLKVSLPTIHDWTNKGILQSYRVGNLKRYKKSEVMNSITPVKRGRLN